MNDGGIPPEVGMVDAFGSPRTHNFKSLTVGIKKTRFYWKMLVKTSGTKTKKKLPGPGNCAHTGCIREGKRQNYVGLTLQTWLCLPEARIGIVTGSNTLSFLPLLWRKPTQGWKH